MSEAKALEALKAMRGLMDTLGGPANRDAAGNWVCWPAWEERLLGYIDSALAALSESAPPEVKEAAPEVSPKRIRELLKKGEAFARYVAASARDMRTGQFGDVVIGGIPLPAKATEAAPVAQTREAESGSDVDGYCDPPAGVASLAPGFVAKMDAIRAELTALRAARKAAGEKPDTEEDSHLASFCPECGWGVGLDEDGCCAGCGATAVGSAVDAAMLDLRASNATRDMELVAALARTDSRITLRAELEAAHGQVAEAMKVLAPNMPESGLVDAARQVKQVAISEAHNSATLERLRAEEKARADAAEKERDRLAAFKAYVHDRLDTVVPPYPDGPHSREGCRIGDRLDLLIGARDAAERRAEEAEALLREAFATATQDKYPDSSPRPAEVRLSRVVGAIAEAQRILSAEKGGGDV